MLMDQDKLDFITQPKDPRWRDKRNPQEVAAVRPVEVKKVDYDSIVDID